MALTKVTGSVIKDSVSLSGNVSVGGTLTYQDVTNVDALGIGTFRTGIKVLAGQVDVGSNIKLGNAGVITATSFVGALTGTASGNLPLTGGTLSGDLIIADSIVHAGDTNTKIRFPAADTITAETGGNERLRILSGGAVVVAGTSAYSDGTFGEAKLQFNTKTGNHIGACSVADTNNSVTHILFKNVQGAVGSVGTHDDDLIVLTGNNERLRIDSSGNVMMGVTSSSNRFHVEGTTTGSRFGVDDSASGITALAITNEVNADLETVIYTNKVSLGSSVNIPICFHTNGKANEKLRIDSSGHMGLGVIPNSNWPTNNDFKALQLGTGACVFGRGSGDEDRGGIAVNWYSTGSGDKYIGNGNAARIYLADGNIYFSNAGANSSGANAAMTLNDRMTIDTSGRILLGDGAIATPKASVGGLDVSSGIYSIIMGGETNVGDGTGRRNSYQKESRLGMPHYTNAEEPFGLVYGVTLSGENRLNLGGGSGIVNAATRLSLYTATNTTTTAGTEQIRMTGEGVWRVGKVTAIAEGNPTEMPRVSSSRGYTSIGRDGASSIIRRFGAYRGSVSGMKLFSRGANSSQTWARVIIGTILGTPSFQACYQEFFYSGNKSLLDSRYRGSNHTGVVTLAWSGDELQFSCNNGNYYSTIEVELGAPNDGTSTGWNPTWGTSW